MDLGNMVHASKYICLFLLRKEYSANNEEVKNKL